MTEILALLVLVVIVGFIAYKKSVGFRSLIGKLKK